MKVLVIGATGLVGKCVVKLLDNSNLKIDKICFIASIKSRNKLIKFRKKYYCIKTVNDINFSDYTHALTLTSSDVSKQIIPSLLINNLVVIDNSSAYRNHHFLTVQTMNFIKNKRLYINPNCCVIQSIIPLFYISKSFNLKKVIYNTYQSCSGGGYRLLRDFNKNKITKCIPNIGGFEHLNDSEEERKMINETKRILDKNIDVYANCVRVPVGYGHLVNVVIKVLDCTVDDIYTMLNTHTKYVDNIDDISLLNNYNIYTTRLKQIKDYTFSFYTYANNVVVGAAYNSFKILEQCSLND